MNARYLERLGFGTAASALDEAALEDFLEDEPAHEQALAGYEQDENSRLSPPSTALWTSSRPDGTGERGRAPAHAPPLRLGVRARRDRDRDRGRLGLGGAPADLVAKPWRRRSASTASPWGAGRSRATTSGRSRFRSSSCTSRMSWASTGRLQASCGRWRRSSRSPSCGTTSGSCSTPPTRSRASSAGRSGGSRCPGYGGFARLLRGNRPLARPRRALGLGGRRCRAVPAPSLDAPRACDLVALTVLAAPFYHRWYRRMRRPGAG